MKDSLTKKLLLNIFFILFSLSFLIPFMYLISLSVSNESAILSDGYKLIPESIDFSAYIQIFRNPKKIIDAYIVTVIFSSATTVLSVIIMSLAAYPLSRTSFKYRQGITFFFYFTMLFSGGLVPSYIVNTRYLHLTNNILVYILPSLVSAYYILIMRTFFRGLPESIMEAAKIDGAGELKIMTHIALPLSKPILATIALLTLLGKWNDWNTALIYITDEKLFSLQYLLQKIIREDEFIRQMSEKTNLAMDVSSGNSVPMESMRFAMAVIAAGPMLVVFPFFQKYFTRGLTLGAVKG